jgi:hypothetical protein
MQFPSGAEGNIKLCVSDRTTDMAGSFSAALQRTHSKKPRVGRYIYEGESNENRKTEIKIRNIALLSYKLADMLPML